MDKKQAIKIVRETFESPFDKGRFTNFIKNLLNEPDLTEGFAARSGKYIPDSFKGYIEKYERLGIYKDREEKRIDLLIVHLKRETSIERARSMQRNFVAGYLQGKFGSDSGKDAALVAFVSPTGEDWRFSLVRLEVRIEAGERGIKVKDEFTPAKRWSFLVGKNEKSHTAQTQFVPIMQDTENNPTLADLEEAFNIEKVTKEFFLKYRELFIRTKEELDRTLRKDARVREEFERKGIDTVNLAKKLLGQIVFLYYLQKKGWFGVPRDAAWGEGSRNFLRELFEKKHGGYRNFFNDILEPLFYEALRIDRSHDDHYYSRFNCKIPFLNGGLFDPMGNYDWVRTDILLPNDLFSNQSQTKEGDTGDGILDIFDRYNFTVKEDEPFEKEVAIDPELLGKAYEKFNAIRPDNYEEYLRALKSDNKNDEGKFNRQYGVFYTPREIVHYMCQQSLVNYLYSELNPNVVYQSLGNDQFDMFGNEGKGGQLDLSVEHRPMMEVPKEDIETLILRGEQIKEHDERVVNEGRETRDYPFLMPESIRQNASLLDGKLTAIKVCDPAVGSGAFPVGMMSEIVKARMALEVYTRPDRSSGKSNRDSSLSAHGFGSAKGSLRPVRSAYQFKRECIENSLYGVDIDAGAVEIAKLRLWLSLVVDEDDPQNIKPLPNLDYKIVCGNSLIGFPENWGSPIEKEIETLIHNHFNETNPVKKSKLKAEIDDKIEKRYKNSLKTFGYQITFDFRTVFSEVFQQRGGFDIVIANPPYDVYEGDKEEEIKTIKKMPIYKIAEGGKLNAYKLFLAKSTKLQRPNGLLCEIFQNSFLADSSASGLRRFFFENQQIIRVDSFPERDDVHRRVFESAKMSVCILISRNLKAGSYPFLLEIWEDRNMTKSKSVRLTNTELLSLDEENATIPLVNEQEMRILRKLAQIPKLIEIAYCYQGEINLTIHDKYLYTTPNGYAPVIKGAAIQKWHLRKKMSQGETVYLNDKKYLKENKGKKSRHHELNRIVTQGITGVDEVYRLKATYLTQGTYCAHSVNYILINRTDVAYQFLLALLNSTILNWFFKKYSTNSNVNSYEVNNLPVPQIATELQEPFVKLVERVLAAKRSNPQADTSGLERQIDELVYQLYGLTEEEIKIVEGKG